MLKVKVAQSIKVARLVNSKLDFTKWFFYNLVILIKLYKIRYQNLDKALLFPRNQVICLKNRKLWGAPTTIKFNIFCWNFAHVSYLTMSTKMCWEWFYFCLDLELLIMLGIFLILFRSWVVNNNVKNECVGTRSFWCLQITPDSAVFCIYSQSTNYFQLFHFLFMKNILVKYFATYTSLLNAERRTEVVKSF